MSRRCRALLSLAIASCTFPQPLLALDPDKRITQFVHTAWTPRDGAPSEIKYLAQTPDGYLWLNTWTTTHRFDGVSFRPWNPPAEFTNLENAWRGAMLVTGDGTLWMGIGNGLARVRGSEFTWTPVTSLDKTIVSLVEEDETHLLVVALDTGLYRFDRRTRAAVKLTEADGVNGKPATVWKDRNGTVWLAAEGIWKGATQRFRRDSSGPYATDVSIAYKPKRATAFVGTGVKVGFVAGFAQAPDGTIWIAETARSVRILQRPGGPFLPEGPEIYVGSPALVSDRNGSLWFPTLGDGLRRVARPAALGNAIVEKNGSKAEAFTEERGLSGDMLYAALEDNEGNVWFGGANGLDRFRDVRLAELTAAEGVRMNLINAFLTPGEKTGVTVASTLLDGLLFHVDAAGGFRSDAVFMDSSDHVAAKGCGPPGTNSVTVVMRAPDGTLWAAGRRVYKREAREWRCMALTSAEGPLTVTSIAAANDGGVWLGTYQHGLWHFAADETMHKVDVSGKTRVNAILSTPGGATWFGGREGLTRLEGSTVHTFRESDGVPGSILAIVPGAGAGDDVWLLGAKGLALVRDARVVRPAALDRLPVAGCWTALRDETHMWFNCPTGLVAVDARELDAVTRDPNRTPSYELFDASEDLDSSPVQGGLCGSLTRSADGQIWFLTRKGLGYLDPRRLDRTAHPPPVHMDGARSGDLAVDATASQTLKPAANGLTISFNAVSLGHPERLRFRYRLEGADDTWKETHNRSVSYANLRAGDYRFHVIAIDHLGTSSEEEAVWSFSIAPLWYETWWFALSAVAGVGMILWLAAWLASTRQTVRLKREFAVQLAERTRIAGELHDTLLQGFQGATLQLHSLAGRLQNTADQAYLNRLLTDIQGVLNDGRKAIWAMRESTTTGPDLNAAFTRVAAMLAPSDAAFRLTEDGEPREMNPIRRDLLYLLGREALANAFRHSGADRIEMILSWQLRAFRLVVRDNGRGIPDDVGKWGREGHFGLAGMRERADRLGGRFELRSTVGRGTEITVTLPATSIYLDSARPWYRSLLMRLMPSAARRQPSLR